MPTIEVLNSTPPPSPRASPVAPQGQLGAHSVSQEAPDSRMPQVPLLPNTSGIALSATPSFSASLPSTPYVYRYTEAVLHWEGKRYRLTLDIPLLQPSSNYSQADLEKAAKEFSEAFFADLKELPSGEHLKVVFSDEGYTIASQGKNISSQGEPSKELSQIIKLGEPAKMIANLQKRAQGSGPVKPPEVSFTSIGLVNQGVRCFANAAFQQWITNPVIRKEMEEHPAYFGGEQNPLSKAFREYMQQGKATCYNLTKLLDALKIKDDRQDDIDVALRAFTAALDFGTIPKDSPLYSQTQKSYLIPQNNSAPLWISKENPEEATLGYRPISPQTKPLANLLKEQSVNEMKEAPLLKSTGQRPSKEKDTFNHPPGVLSVYVRRTTPNNEKDTTPIQIDSLDVHLPKEVCGEEADYELMSYGLHLGEIAGSGHWVAYVREGEDFIRISDSERALVSKEEFLENARRASSYMLNRKA